ncbi:helix-turn-helix domain-containing protein [Bosea sp. PAMC 26642]|uniref:helix-turn-helix domain-containing protein n=1 Tax=Bosea sp. (strain PAMC 26642) TaxID=1792307 RepID=UPI0007702708|nr:helix-turn-helix transcriptional regulator [Bosea sp. PAMC 26642]AMJ59646.1 hypothetical protein AXW83_04410 [Bosea sp. PAMC 26642]
MAALTDLSVYHFVRAFKRSTGHAPHAYLIRIRVENARRLLEATDRSLTEIAFDVGYESPQSLARAFNKVLGLSPTTYRRQRERS